ncbi:iron(III) ABC transporter ATP-binding protein [Neiella marina]|uniref:Iron(III) ABC transporter ATP-binding protein n=1 Tax=Neiella marina TaxID=508461 RepID=A0A8J2U7L7_9GAMM|nr:ABC transporter ATP-binding protein [Neiella marina]GGA83976.1 iron(III) ABC transporter ATP-binding protein [Neiella marina]
MNQANAMLELNQVRLRFKQQQVLDCISLNQLTGEINCLLGPSGCGKSTLLKLIAGLIKPDSGTISMAGKELSSKRNVIAPEQRQIGMVFQDLALFPHLTVAENICFGLYQQPKQQQQQRLQQLLELIGLTAKAEQYPSALSGGQQQRVALARALAPKPKLLLLDEPFSGFDSHLKSTLVPELRQILKHEGITSLIVTHDQHEAFALADRVAVMNDGQVHQYDTPQQIYRCPASAFVARFIGSGQLIAGKVTATAIETALGTLPLPSKQLAGNSEVSVLIRAEDIQYDPSSHISLPVVSQTYCGNYQRYQVRLEDDHHLFIHLATDLAAEIEQSIPIVIKQQQTTLFDRGL